MRYTVSHLFQKNRRPLVAARHYYASPRTFQQSDKSEEEYDARELMRRHMQALKLSRSYEPIPYDASFPIVPVNDPPGKQEHKKVSIVGAGQVGMAIAYSILNQMSAGTIALVDQNAEKLLGEAKDLEQGSGFHENVRVLASNQYGVTSNSDLVIVTAGAAQRPGESRLNLLERNVSIMQSIIPPVLSQSPDATICIVSNPCDIMTAVANKIAGQSVPPGRIFGSGTCLDSSRLQSLLAKTLEIDARSVSGYVVGEHGDHSVALWSSVRIGGIPMLHPGDEPTEIHKNMHREVIDSAYDVILRKGYTNWAVGLTGAYIAKAVLNDQRNIFPVSTCVRGIQGIKEDVFLSMPCSISARGVRRIIDTPMTDTESAQFKEAAATIWGLQKDIWKNI